MTPDRVTLKFGDKHRIIKWIEANWTRIQQQCPTYKQVAAEVSESLGLKVSDRVLKDMLDEVEMAWKPPGTQSGKPQLRHQCNALEERCRQLESKVALLETAIQQIYRDMGIVPHPDYSWPADRNGLPVVTTGASR